MQGFRIRIFQSLLFHVSALFCSWWAAGLAKNWEWAKCTAASLPLREWWWAQKMTLPNIPNVFFFAFFCCVWGFIFLWLLARSRCCQFSLSSGCSVWTFFSVSLCWCETVYIVSHHNTMFVYVFLFMQHSLALKTQETDHNFEVIGLCHFHFAQGMLRLWHWSHFPEL